MRFGAWSFNIVLMTEYERLAGRLRGRRADLHLSQVQVAVKAGVGESAIRALESGRRDSFRATTLRAVSAALDWTPDSAERILDGDEPVEATTDANEPDLAGRVAALEAELARVRRQLERVTAERDGYPIDADDPEEVELWALDTIPEAERWRLIEHLRKLRTERERRSG